MVQNVIKQYWPSRRKKIATIICERLHWRGLNGHLKVIPCLEALRKNKLWRYLIQRYHYLGYTRPVGRHLKYFVYLGDKLVALISFSDGIYHHHLRDNWLGWDEKTKAPQRHLIINNNRFLILPWVQVKNLGSKILATAAKIVLSDWFLSYGYRPEFFETFVDAQRFKGTVYKAANGQLLGQTKGKGRRGARYFFHGRVRDYYIYSLMRH